MIAEASGHTAAASGLVNKFNDIILYPLITLLLAIAFLVFVWGAFQYVLNADSDEARSTGRKHMLYGVIGMLVMLSAWSILIIATATFGINVPDATTGP